MLRNLKKYIGIVFCIRKLLGKVFAIVAKFGEATQQQLAKVNLTFGVQTFYSLPVKLCT